MSVYQRFVDSASSTKSHDFILNSNPNFKLYQEKSFKNHKQTLADAILEQHNMTTDPVLRDWLRAMRFDSDLEDMGSLSARTLAIDQYSAAAMGVRNSQVAIQEMRANSNMLLEFIDQLIAWLPLNVANVASVSLAKYQFEFSELWRQLMIQTQLEAADWQQVNQYQLQLHSQQQSHVSSTPSHKHQATTTICTPRKEANAAMSKWLTKPLEQLRSQMRSICIEIANHLNDSAQVVDEQQLDSGRKHVHKYLIPGHNSRFMDSCSRNQTPSSSHSINTNLINKKCTNPVDNGLIECSLRKIKELFGRFVEIFIRAKCANIVRALDYNFTLENQTRSASMVSLKPSRPFESSASQLPLKWALIALWQLTQDDSYLCRTLTEKWQTLVSPDKLAQNSSSQVQQDENMNILKPRAHDGCSAKKRLDYSTKYDHQHNEPNHSQNTNTDAKPKHSLQCDYEKLYQTSHRQHQGNSNLPFAPRHFSQNNANNCSTGLTNNQNNQQSGALMSALKVKQEVRVAKQLSTIELLMEVIISQPNKHERIDMMNFIHEQAKHDRLIDLDEWDQSVSAAYFTSNQYKVAALCILNHLCVNDTAIKTILRCLSTPPAAPGQKAPENKIIRSIFECYQTSQEHIYQNETHISCLKPKGVSSIDGTLRSRKRAKQCTPRPTDQNIFDSLDGHQQRSSTVISDDYSDYGSRPATSNTRSPPNYDLQNNDSWSSNGTSSTSESDDLVVKEAIKLIIQLTNPFHRSCQGTDYYNLIGRYSIDLLVGHLTQIMKLNTSREMVLLSLTALANISFITTEPLKRHHSNVVMLGIFHTSTKRSKDLELRDQAVTILANTADKSVPETVGNGGLAFLLSCLESCPYSRLSLNDQAAMERIHQKTAIAFNRMASDPGTVSMLKEYGGIKQLIQLCKYSHKRNHSDIVLIACLAALKNLAKVIDTDVFKNYNALDLIELDLAKALVIYGNCDSSPDQQAIFRLISSEV